ncbi:phosphate ABC transporter substrate-binding protein [Oenococcus kitaharae]|uniref:Phosphate-binding protein n=1 Tax=Oenococcus kitaharae DSM 17330 TaxID=1045004 RepID=G9WFD9_9LACO|nr:phosphate ABC transporter substrate-binding protein [Oenococcus kitaharae]EHN59096.1 Phosphate ABC transporterperiplasmic phosphate-binding protein [Oenococcus kitaharae DSM 17330]OEY82021.1 phosphate ABC transporter substrate-binding protein [Oenococcus kitaharae]OEY82392.1 phosphate ABC transporter substrate-binding protein [Oenococcus kitaharae]OEY82798.1 phosphate ABC transporter substrate-binding protein [Oenococcus kitaharae]
MRKWLLSLLALVAISGASLTSVNHGTSAFAASKSKLTGKVLAVGSTALQPLAEQIGERFSSAHPAVQVTVQGGGSGAGLTQVQAGSVQVGNSDVFAEEKDGIDASVLVDHKVAVVGIAPVVNSDVSVRSLTKSQLKDIFTGKVTNWNQVGGKDEKIVLINRAAGSGTRAVFEKAVLGDATAATAQEQDSNGTVQKIISTTPGSISYLAFGYIKGQTGLRALKLKKIAPTAKNVRTNKWPIWGYEHMYTRGKAKGATKAFISYFHKKSVKGIIRQLGYIPLSEMKVTKDADGVVTTK